MLKYKKYNSNGYGVQEANPQNDFYILKNLFYLKGKERRGRKTVFMN